MFVLEEDLRIEVTAQLVKMRALNKSLLVLVGRVDLAQQVLAEDQNCPRGATVSGAVKAR